MKTIRKIMVATDFSKDSQSALDEAVILAEKLNAEVFLFHTVDPVADCVSDYCLSEDQAEGVKSNALSNARMKLEQEAGRFKDRIGVSIKSDLRYGRAFEEILNAEKEKDIDLLVIGPHARKTVWQRMITHLSDKLERKSNVDTLVVHSAA